jgi:hypothetical protein
VGDRADRALVAGRSFQFKAERLRGPGRDHAPARLRQRRLRHRRRQPRRHREAVTTIASSQGGAFFLVEFQPLVAMFSASADGIMARWTKCEEASLKAFLHLSLVI